MDRAQNTNILNVSLKKCGLLLYHHTHSLIVQSTCLLRQDISRTGSPRNEIRRPFEKIQRLFKTHKKYAFCKNGRRTHSVTIEKSLPSGMSRLPTKQRSQCTLCARNLSISYRSGPCSGKTPCLVPQQPSYCRHTHALSAEVRRRTALPQNGNFSEAHPKPSIFVGVKPKLNDKRPGYRSGLSCADGLDETIPAGGPPKAAD